MIANGTKPATIGRGDGLATAIDAGIPTFRRETDHVALESLTDPEFRWTELWQVMGTVREVLHDSVLGTSAVIERGQPTEIDGIHTKAPG
jgi:hypothetical protein